MVSSVGKLLIKKKLTLAIAESCSGGLLSNFITDIPGSSRYFLLGVVAYSNKAKTSLLKIPAEIIRKKGAVSKEVAMLMAKSIKNIAKANLGIGITGIAGPAGATNQKPLGLVFIAIANKNKISCEYCLFKGNRRSVKKQSALKALRLLKSCLENR